MNPSNSTKKATDVDNELDYKSTAMEKGESSICSDRASTCSQDWLETLDFSTNKLMLEGTVFVDTKNVMGIGESPTIPMKTAEPLQDHSNWDWLDRMADIVKDETLHISLYNTRHIDLWQSEEDDQFFQTTGIPSNHYDIRLQVDLLVKEKSSMDFDLLQDNDNNVGGFEGKMFFEVDTTLANDSISHNGS
jgi:hypothetical protein